MYLDWSIRNLPNQISLLAPKGNVPYSLNTNNEVLGFNYVVLFLKMNNFVPNSLPSILTGNRLILER